jgi:hypothetical protein
LRIKYQKCSSEDNKIEEVKKVFTLLEKRFRKTEKNMKKVKEKNIQLEICVKEMKEDDSKRIKEGKEIKKKLAEVNREKNKLKQERKKWKESQNEQNKELNNFKQKLVQLELEKEQRKTREVESRRMIDSEKNAMHSKLNQMNSKLEKLFEENEQKNRLIKNLKKQNSALKSQFEVQLHENNLLSDKLKFQQESKSKKLLITPQNQSKIPKTESCKKMQMTPRRFYSTERLCVKSSTAKNRNGFFPFSPKEQILKQSVKSSKIGNLIDNMDMEKDIDKNESLVLSRQTNISSESAINELNSLRSSVHQLNRQKIDIFREMTLLNDKFVNSKNENNKLQNLVSTCLNKINQLNEIKGKSEK